MSYAKGCYADGKVAHYVPAVPGKMYKLEYVPLSIRSMYDPYVVYTRYTSTEDIADTQHFFCLSVICLVVSVLIGIYMLILYTGIKKASAEEVSPVLPR